MTRNESLGPLDVLVLDVFEVNDRLRQIVQRIDELKGLLGPITLTNDLTVNGFIVIGEIEGTGFYMFPWEREYTV